MRGKRRPPRAPHWRWVFAFIAAIATAPALRAAVLPLEQSPVIRKKWTGDFDGMLARGYMRVLVVYNKTLYFVDRGQQRGVAYESFKEFENVVNQRLNKTKGTKARRVFHVVFIPVKRDALLLRLVEGFGDVVAANLTITPKRQRLVDFSSPIYRGVKEIVVTGPRSPRISSVEDLSGQKVFVRKSSSYYESLLELNRTLRREGKPEVILEPAPEELEDEDLLEMVNAGLVGIVVVDSHKAEFWRQIFSRIRLHPEVAVRQEGDIAWAIRKKSPKLKAELDAFIKSHGAGTSFGNTILRRYLKDTKYVKDATSPRELKKFQALVALFRKYADQYDVDPFLMAAQGYQESRLNQSVRSRSGAIGVMQVLPKTGRELKVGDIAKVEPNIHAGVKYIRFMIDQYYANEPMAPIDKGLFAFASYNAGPARIQQMRKLAKARGLDPNRWFNNVELVVAEKVGREPVQYVSNVYKYYIAYKLVAQARAAKEKAKQSVNGAGR